MFCSENCSQNFTACSIAYKKSFPLSQELASKIYFHESRIGIKNLFSRLVLFIEFMGPCTVVGYVSTKKFKR